MSKTRRVVLIHWNEAEAAQRLRATRVRGFRLEHQAPRSGEDWARFRADLPAAVVIDLSRLPSHGREVALGLRGTKATRSMPIVFVGGAPEKVAAVRARVGDAPFCDWDGLAPALVKAIAAPPVPAPRPRVRLPAPDGWRGRAAAAAAGGLPAAAPAPPHGSAPG